MAIGYLLNEYVGMNKQKVWDKEFEFILKYGD